MKASPFIDEESKTFFCNDAFEIAWIVEKAHYLLKFTKKQIKERTVINYDAILEKFNKFTIAEY